MLLDYTKINSDYHQDSELLYLTDAIEASVFAEMEAKKLKAVRNQTAEISLVDATFIKMKKLFFWTKSQKKICNKLKLQEEKIRSYVEHKIMNQLRKRKNAADYLREFTMSEIKRGRKNQELALAEQLKNLEFEKDLKKRSRRVRRARDYGAMIVGGSAAGSGGMLAWMAYKHNQSVSAMGYEESLSGNAISVADLGNLKPTKTIGNFNDVATNFAKLDVAAGNANIALSNTPTSFSDDSYTQIASNQVNYSNSLVKQSSLTASQVSTSDIIMARIEEDNNSSTSGSYFTDSTSGEIFSTEGSSGNASSGGTNGSVTATAGSTSSSTNSSSNQQASVTPTNQAPAVAGTQISQTNPIATGQIPLPTPAAVQPNPAGLVAGIPSNSGILPIAPAPLQQPTPAGQVAGNNPANGLPNQAAPNSGQAPVVAGKNPASPNQPQLGPNGQPLVAAPNTPVVAGTNPAAPNQPQLGPNGQPLVAAPNTPVVAGTSPAAPLIPASGIVPSGQPAPIAPNAQTPTGPVVAGNLPPASTPQTPNMPAAPNPSAVPQPAQQTPVAPNVAQGTSPTTPTQTPAPTITPTKAGEPQPMPAVASTPEKPKPTAGQPHDNDNLIPATRLEPKFDVAQGNPSPRLDVDKIREQLPKSDVDKIRDIMQGQLPTRSDRSVADLGGNGPNLDGGKQIWNRETGPNGASTRQPDQGYKIPQEGDLQKTASVDKSKANNLAPETERAVANLGMGSQMIPTDVDLPGGTPVVPQPINNSPVVQSPDIGMV